MIQTFRMSRISNIVEILYLRDCDLLNFLCRRSPGNKSNFWLYASELQVGGKKSAYPPPASSIAAFGSVFGGRFLSFVYIFLYHTGRAIMPRSKGTELSP